MSQKLPFNNITAQPLIPLVSNEAVLFHRLTDADANALWALHMWVAPNSTITSDAEQANLVVYVTPPGEGPLSPNAVPIASRVFRYRATAPWPDGDAEVGDQNTVKLVCDGIPVRGPVDLYVASVQAAGNMTAFGYMVRGEAAAKTERRFFDPSGDIGDQVSNFSGGAAPVLSVDPAGPTTDSVIIHNSSDDYIDEVTLDVLGLVAEADRDETIFSIGWEGSPVEAGMVLRVGGANPLRVFDGLPVRGGGGLGAVQTQIGAFVLAPVIFNGFFVRG